ncbi:MAG: hypothetical protein AB7G37_20375, partial [Solirubrobacteraceae bacterium]
MRRRRVTLAAAGAILVLLLVLLVLLVRSWSADEGDRARGTVERFGTAVATRDYPLICSDLLASRLRDVLQEAGLPCEQALRLGLGEVRSPTLKVMGAEVDGDQARVKVRTGAAGQPSSQDALRLILEDDEWRITALTTAGEETATGTTTAPTPPAGGEDPTHTVTDTTPLVPGTGLGATPGSVGADANPGAAGPGAVAPGGSGAATPGADGPDTQPGTASTTSTPPVAPAKRWPRPPAEVVDELRRFAAEAAAERRRERDERRQRQR